MHDRYRSWPMPYDAVSVSPIRKVIEQQVLEDLANTDSEKEKLEILDSYAAYAKRCYREAMIRGFNLESGRIAASIFGPWLRELIPQVQVLKRATKTKE